MIGLEEMFAAYLDGKEVQWRSKTTDENHPNPWRLTTNLKNWPIESLLSREFRTKPEPLVIYINEFPGTDTGDLGGHSVMKVVHSSEGEAARSGKETGLD